MKIEKILIELGLTGQEVRVYLALLKLQESRTGKLCNFTNIPSSNIYKILDSLIKKGLISYKIKNNIKIYMPTSPDVLNELFLEKQKNLENQRKNVINLISQLKKVEVEEEDYSNYKYYEGFNGVKSMWYELIGSKKETTIKVYTGKEEAYERLTGFFTEQHKIRIKKKIKAEIIFHIKDKEHALKRKKLPLTEVKFLDLENLGEWGVMDDYFFIMYIATKTPRAFLIKDKIFAETFNQTFGQLWKIAKS